MSKNQCSIEGQQGLSSHNSMIKLLFHWNMWLFLPPSEFNGARGQTKIYMGCSSLSRGRDWTTKASSHWECDHKYSLWLCFSVDCFKWFTQKRTFQMEWLIQKLQLCFRKEAVKVKIYTLTVLNWTYKCNIITFCIIFSPASCPTFKACRAIKNVHNYYYFCHDRHHCAWPCSKGGYFSLKKDNTGVTVLWKTQFCGSIQF